MKINRARFETSAVNLEACTYSRLPEFAFVGRSNVGKSSLINMLTERKDLAKTSSKPGKTQLINFFEINETWSLVDLPGYGYAKASKKMKKAFNISVSGYLTGRENLKHVFVLVDSRLEPMEGDLAFIEWLVECALPYSIVFTKTDKISNNLIKDNAALFLENLEAWKIEPPAVFNCSSKTKAGRMPILKFIEKFLPHKLPLKKKPTISTGWMNKGKFD